VRNCGISHDHPPWVGAQGLLCTAVSGSTARGERFTMKLTSEHRGGARRRSGVSADYEEGERGRVGDSVVEVALCLPFSHSPPLLKP
jgi:hypothetical protein